MIRRLALTISILAAAAAPALAQAAAHDSTECAAIMATLHTAIQAHIADGTLDSAAVANIHAVLMSAHHTELMGQTNSAAADSVHATLRAMLMGPNAHIQLDSATHAQMAIAVHGALMCTGKM